MTYRGNPSLPAEIQQRISSTFEQALRSAKEGAHREALLGCDFILKLDQEFEPAKILADRLRQQGQGGGGAGLGQELKALFDQGEHQQVVELASRHQDKVMGDPEMRRLATEAQERLSTEQLLSRLLERAETAVSGGDVDQAKGLLDKARAVAPDDPRLSHLEERLEAQSFAAAAAELPAIDDPLAGFDIDVGQGIFDGAIDPPPLEDSSAAPSGAGDETIFAPPLAIDTPLALDADDPLASFAFDSLPEEPSGEVPVDHDVESLFDNEAADFSDLDAELDDDLDFSLGGLDAIDSLETGSPAEPSGLDANSGAGGDSPGGDRVSGLLKEGDKAFDQGDFQAAIDAWSRIFLIDIDHEEASRRIERARKLKAEVERQTEEILHEGLAAYESGDLEGAREPFERVLELNPGHTVAGEYLQKIEAGELPDITRTPTFDTPVAGQSLSPPGEPVLKEEILVPPDPDAARAAAAPPPKASKTAAPSRRFLMIGVGSLLLFALIGGFLFANWDRFFPNRDAEPVQEVVAENPIETARKLAAGGRTRLAVAQLERIPVASPHYEAAQKLIVELETATLVGPELDAEVAEIAEGESAREDLVEQARRALASGRALRADELLTEAAELSPLNAEESALMQKVAVELEPYSTELQLFKDGDWTLALPGLWRLHLAEPSDGDLRRLLVSSYFNLGVRHLQRGEVGEAADSFAEIAELSPQDEQAERHQRFAEAYREQPPDLLYRIYVKYLPFR